MTARHHHYISQCYLKGFTKGRAKKSKLTVFDFSERKSFETIPRNIGGIRDFNRIDIEGVDQNKFEADLAEFEGAAASALKKLEDTMAFEGEVRDAILLLIAMLAVRGPEQREHIRKLEERIMNQVMGLTLQSKERWQSQVRQIQKENQDFQDNVSYEELKDFFLKNEHRIELAREHHIRMEMVQVNAILPCLEARNWSLVKASAAAGPFITSDNPVSLSWIDPSTVPLAYRRSPGYGLTGTQVYFPVSQELVLMGQFDKPAGVVEATEELVALGNTTMLNGFFRQIYSPKAKFKFCGAGGDIMEGNRIVKDFNV